MTNPPFEVIFSSYVDQHHISWGNAFKRIPTRIKWLLLGYVLIILFFVYAYNSKKPKHLLLSIFALFIINLVLDRVTKQFLKPGPDTLPRYRKNTIMPLRALLKKHRLYSAPGIQYLLTRCNEEIKQETTIEKINRILKSFFSFFWKFFCIASFGILLKHIGVAPTSTQASSMFLDFITFFDTYEALALLTLSIIFACEIAFLYYEIQIFGESVTNRRRNKIRLLSEDLQFILIDFQNR